MKKINHGIISLILAAISIGTGLYVIITVSLTYAIIYIAGTFLLFDLVIYAYCTKCPSRNCCGHILPGKLTKYFPKRKDGPYTFLDYMGVIIPIIFIFIFPQFWLWKNYFLFVVFWLSLLVAVFEINKFVCPPCLNTKCAFCRNKIPI